MRDTLRSCLALRYVTTLRGVVGETPSDHEGSISIQSVIMGHLNPILYAMALMNTDAKGGGGTV